MNKISEETFHRILESVRRPSTYLGSEINSVHKDISQMNGSIALVFPDLYELGMSHLGLKILYNIINDQPDLVAERAFAPGEDFAEAIQKEGIPLMSLESRKPLIDFDFLGFTIPYELSYTNILWILDLAGIPLRSKDRSDGHPIVVGGGAGVFNPEPIADFFDLFVLGDGEEIALRILREGADAKDEERRETVKRLAKIPGVYTPSLYNVEYANDGKIKRLIQLDESIEKPVRVNLPTLSESPFPYKMVVPFGRPVHDRLNVEIDRGCTQGCRFCQAGSTYRPARERTPGEVVDIFEKALKETGYGDISLTSLSAGDYSKIEELLKALMDRYEHERISVSMPSMRSGCVTEGVVEQIKRVRRTGFTITAEAGSERLRNVLNKKVSEEEIIDTATRLLKSGWQGLKLYFMIGLPTETDHDIEAIYLLARKLAELKVEKRRFKNISVSVSNFVPKSHTAFQWLGQETIENLISKKERLFDLIKPNKRLRLKWSDAKASHLEAVFSRGDRRLSHVVEEAYRAGRKFDAWTEHFDFGQWMKAFDKVGLDPAFYANRDFEETEVLPWDHLDIGLTKAYFLNELKLGREGKITGDCKDGKCLLCGIDPKSCFDHYEWSDNYLKTPEPGQSHERYKYRLTYYKKETAKFFSQLETQSILIRAFRMAEISFAYSQGFSPHPRISFGTALPVGVESDGELVDVKLTRDLDPADIIGRINHALPAGLKFINANRIAIDEKSIGSATDSFEYSLILDGSLDLETLSSTVRNFNEKKSVMIEKSNSGKQFDIRLLVDDLKVEANGMSLKFRTGKKNRGAARPDDLLRALFPGRKVLRRAVKTQTYMAPTLP